MKTTNNKKRKASLERVESAMGSKRPRLTSSNSKKARQEWTCGACLLKMDRKEFASTQSKMGATRKKCKACAESNAPIKSEALKQLMENATLVRSEGIDIVHKGEEYKQKWVQALVLGGEVKSATSSVQAPKLRTLKNKSNVHVVKVGSSTTPKPLRKTQIYNRGSKLRAILAEVDSEMDNLDETTRLAIWKIALGSGFKDSITTNLDKLLKDSNDFIFEQILRNKGQIYWLVLLPHH